jgi:hypothetical protein
MSAKFGVVLLVGQGDKELVRGRDLIDSLRTYEPGNFRLILVDDDVSGRRLVPKIASGLEETSVELLNPRRGRSEGWGSGSTVGILAGLRCAAAMKDLEFVVKVDTDTLIIRSFSGQIKTRFREQPRIGMLGQYLSGPNKEYGAPFLEKLLRQFAFRYRVSGGIPMLQVAFWGRFKRMRDTIRSALLEGYRLGEHCQGGGYAISRSCLEAFESKGLFDDPCSWLYFSEPLGEDRIVSMCAVAGGFLLQGYNRDGEPFGVQYRGLADSPQRMMARGFAIIHSVKDHGDQKEDDTRAFFRALRENCVMQIAE